MLLSPAPNPHALRPLPALSFAPVTRPETLSIVLDHARPALRRLSRIVPAISERIDVRIEGRTAEAIVALSHMRHAAEGFGYPADPMEKTARGANVKVRDVRLIDAAALHEAGPAWLAGANVAVLHSVDGLSIRRDGSARFGATTIDQVILADDGAILQWMDADEIASFARIEHWTGIETAPQRPGRYRAGFDLDTGTVFAQSSDGIIRAAARDDDGKALPRIADCLSLDPAPRLAARASLTRLCPDDGAPVLGPTRRGKLFVVAGLGVLDLILAPLVAGIIAEQASGLEIEWAAAHGADLRQPRRDIAEFHPGLVAGGAQ
ncbi:hypothetical protein KKY_781 [Pelagibacterium halotolerans B2]|uniref:FAD dependent oxidoreductase n=1 Tax=Pelagibacterium halotolerans (strain DSM 22347 / JCM 15775 / CGMCC 1.7692 / B2) TaxID=1082931 RepID=G4RE26_PELHB|nr:hypothetical protein KKY_781 [Pelagibacterium halotolerans B2]